MATNGKMNGRWTGIERPYTSEDVERLRDGGRWDDAREVFEQVALGEDFVEFLTLPAYDHLD